jgi:hypothetical protein
MFEVGKSYTIYEIDADGLGYHLATVLDWQPPLLKVAQANGGYAIHNTASQYFHRAELHQSAHPQFDADQLMGSSPE